MSLQVPVSWGELVDKITILEIKMERIGAPDKRANVEAELTALIAVHDRQKPSPPALAALTEELRSVNRLLWDIEDEIRDCERRQDFGPRFIELARSVYGKNDQRAAVKRRINILLGSDLVEEKSYRDYD
jgi:hypothetical protein